MLDTSCYHYANFMSALAPKLTEASRALVIATSRANIVMSNESPPLQMQSQYEAKRRTRQTEVQHCNIHLWICQLVLLFELCLQGEAIIWILRT